MKQETRIHIRQNKNGNFFGVGDVVEGKCIDGYSFNGKIMCIEIRKQDDMLHTIMDFQGTNGQGCVWIENITELKIVQFKGE